MESKLISKLIYERILKNIKELTVQFNKTEPDIGYFFIDDLFINNLIYCTCVFIKSASGGYVVTSCMFFMKQITVEGRPDVTHISFSYERTYRRLETFFNQFGF